MSLYFCFILFQTWFILSRREESRCFDINLISKQGNCELAVTIVLKGVLSSAAVFFAHVTLAVEVLRTARSSVPGTDCVMAVAPKIAVGTGKGCESCQN